MMWIGLIATFLNMSWALPGMGNGIFQPMQMVVRPGDQLKINGVHGRLRLIQDSRYRNLHVQVNQRHQKLNADWHVVVERRGQSIEIEVFSIANAHQWPSDAMSSAWPDYDITIHGPSLPVQASWREGRIEVSQWAHPLDIALLEGSLMVNQSKGSLNVQGAQLNLQLNQYDGQVKFSADKGQLAVTRSQGKLSAQLMEGSLRLSHFAGELDWRSERAALVSSQGTGQWSLKSTNGAVSIDQFKGSIKGVGDKGVWRLQVSDVSDVEIQSQSGPVHVRWNRGAAKAFLSSKSGLIRAPQIAKVHREEGAARWLAQWGQGNLGQLFVNTQSGSISLNK